MINIATESKQEKERVYLVFRFQSIINGSQGRNSSWEPGGKNWNRDHRGVLFLACYLLYTTQSHFLRVCTVHNGVGFPNQYESRNCSTDLPTGQSDRSSSLDEIPSPQVCLGFIVKLTKTNQHSPHEERWGEAKVMEMINPIWRTREAWIATLQGSPRVLACYHWFCDAMSLPALLMAWVVSVAEQCNICPSETAEEATVLCVTASDTVGKSGRSPDQGIVGPAIRGGKSMFEKILVWKLLVCQSYFLFQKFAFYIERKHIFLLSLAYANCSNEWVLAWHCYMYIPCHCPVHRYFFFLLPPHNSTSLPWTLSPFQ